MFGSASNASSAPFSFGQNNQSNAAPGAISGQQGGLFGNAQKPATGGLFGSSSNTGGGLFGGSSNNQSSAPAFGGSTVSGGLFGQKPAASGGLFGSNNNTNNTNNANNSNTANTGGLFGNNASANNNNASNGSSGGLFGSAPSTSNSTGMFGNSNTGSNTGTTGGGLFGNTGSNTNTAQNGTSGGLFGSSNNSNSGGLFGNANQSASSTSGGLFGQKPAAPATGGLFGAKPAAPSGGLFGSNTNTTQNTNSGGLFGQTQSNTGGLFGQQQNQQAQQPSQSQLTPMTRFLDLPQDMKNELQQLDQYINKQHLIATTLNSDLSKHDQLVKSIPSDVGYLHTKISSVKHALRSDAEQLKSLKGVNDELTEDISNIMQLIIQLATPGTKLSSSFHLNEFFVNRIKKYREMLNNYEMVINESAAVTEGLERACNETTGNIYSVVEVVRNQYGLFMELCEVVAQLHGEVGRL